MEHRAADEWNTEQAYEWTHRAGEWHTDEWNTEQAYEWHTEQAD